MVDLNNKLENSFWDEALGRFYSIGQEKQHLKDIQKLHQDATIGYVTRVFLMTAVLLGSTGFTVKTGYNMLPVATKQSIQQQIQQYNQTVLEYRIPIK